MNNRTYISGLDALGGESHIVESVESTAKWTAAIALGVVGLLGFVAYKIVTSQTGAAVAGAATHAYLDGYR